MGLRETIMGWFGKGGSTASESGSASGDMAQGAADMAGDAKMASDAAEPAEGDGDDDETESS